MAANDQYPYTATYTEISILVPAWAMPADRLGLTDRGRIREGAYADLVVFDPATVADRATFQDPHQYPVGIDWVVVNGVVAVEAGRYLDRRPGRVLRREG